MIMTTQNTQQMNIVQINQDKKIAIVNTITMQLNFKDYSERLSQLSRKLINLCEY